MGKPFEARWSKEKIVKLSRPSPRDIKHGRQPDTDPLQISGGDSVRDVNEITVGLKLSNWWNKSDGSIYSKNEFTPPDTSNSSSSISTPNLQLNCDLKIN